MLAPPAGGALYGPALLKTNMSFHPGLARIMKQITADSFISLNLRAKFCVKYPKRLSSWNTNENTGTDCSFFYGLKETMDMN